ncbi:MAG TPA: CoA pyrophosphatase [Gemmatimonadales bacterium]
MPLAHPLTNRLLRLRQRLAEAPRQVEQDPSVLWAAVAVVLTPDPDAILLIRRAEREGDPWSGHMALPGGRKNLSDEDLLATVIRETREEVGMTLRADQLIGCLDDVAPRTPTLPPIAIRPFVFVLPARPTLTLNPEVASTRWADLDRLLHPETYRSVRLDIRGERREFPAYQLEDAVVWGMTERILTALLRQLNC